MQPEPEPEPEPDLPPPEKPNEISALVRKPVALILEGDCKLIVNPGWRIVVRGCLLCLACLSARTRVSPASGVLTHAVFLATAYGCVYN